MDTKVKEHVRQILNEYLETNGGRKTPERYAILDAIYSQKGHFTLQQINQYLLKGNFRVSRATVFNTIKLLIALRLVVKHVLPEGTFYEAGYKNDCHCHQVCTQCGKTTELRLPEMATAVSRLRLKRFRREGFVLYIYGLCSVCHTKATRRVATTRPKSKVTRKPKNTSKNKETNE